MSEKKQLGEKGFRHELKYYITEGDYALLKRKLSLTMEQDALPRRAAGNILYAACTLTTGTIPPSAKSWTARTSATSSAYAYTTCGTT